MPPYCELCGTKKVPAEENAHVCPACGQDSNETPRTCDYCHAHVASMPSTDGTCICDHCILQSIVGPVAHGEILAVQSHLARETGHSVSLGDAFTAWRQLSESRKIKPTSPASEVNAPAS